MRNDPETGQSGFVIPDDAPPSDLLLIKHMARAIQDLPDLSHPPSRLHAYRKSNVSEEQIKEYDQRAKIMAEAILETKPRASMASIVAQVAGTTGMLALGLFVTGLASTFPDCARAASATIAQETDWSFVDGLAALGMFLIALFFIHCAVCIAFPHRRPELVGDENFGPEPTREQRMREAEGQS